MLLQTHFMHMYVSLEACGVGTIVKLAVATSVPFRSYIHLSVDGFLELAVAHVVR